MCHKRRQIEALPYVGFIKQTHNWLQLIVLYRRWAITVTFPPDYRQEWSRKWPCQYTVSQNTISTRNSNHKKLISTVTLGWRTRWADFIWIRSSELEAAIFIRQHVLRWLLLTSTWDHGNNEQSIAAASRRESEKRSSTVDGRHGQRGRPAEGAADCYKRCNCQASVRADGRPTGRQTTLHLPGSRRRASGQAAALRGDKRVTTARSDERVLSLFRPQSDGMVGKTVRQ